jgi:transcriptional regulator with XRE-family HTH domain
MNTANYHHGLVIRRYRKLQHIKQSQLAEQWPNGPVSTSYVQKVESGERQINDPQTLRQLSNILHIPLWEFGLSDYDPFNPHAIPENSASLYPETLETIDQLIQITWFLRRSAPIGNRSKHKKTPQIIHEN